MKLVWVILGIIMLFSAISIPPICDSHRGGAKEDFFFGVSFGGARADNMNKLIGEYGLRLDIIYNDTRFMLLRNTRKSTIGAVKYP